MEEEMSVQIQSIRQDVVKTGTTISNWSNIYLLGGVAAVLVLLTALAEIAITFLPGGYTTAETVTDWFSLLQANCFLGLRNLGLLNIVMVAFGIPLYLALYAAHRNVNQAFAALAMLISYIGVAVFYATNRAFPMLALSNQYVMTASEAQRTMFEAVGQAMLAVGQSHTPGTFLAFCLSEIAGMLMAMVMLQGKVFSRGTAYTGLIGFGLLFVFEILSSFTPSVHDAILILAMVGGIASMIWYILIARRLLQLRLDERGDAK
jgi:hypothetical protein